jgi:hypothetical protein
MLIRMLLKIQPVISTVHFQDEPWQAWLLVIVKSWDYILGSSIEQYDITRW